MTGSGRDAKRAAVEIIRLLREHGHIALLAGGCVRDLLLGRTPEDYDVATDAVPQRVVELFAKTRQVGAQFGVVLVKSGGVWVEVATFRSDHSYEDGRHPVAVTFSDPRNDALRRDFTINGMFYDPTTDQVIDYVGGQADLQAGLIRTIGDADQRFSEDRLRLIRAVRFAAKLQYTIEPDTRRAIRKHAATITSVSAERIREELEKILTDRHRAEAVRELAELDLLTHLWPASDWAPERIDLSVSLLSHLPPRVRLALPLACLLIHWPGAQVSRICRSLTCSNELRNRVVWLVEHYGDLLTPDSLGLADIKLLMAERGFKELLSLTQAWLKATGGPMTAYDEITRRCRAIPADEVAPAALIDGEDLIALGLAPGPTFKRVLDEVYRAQLEASVLTKREAIDLARDLVGRS